MKNTIIYFILFSLLAQTIPAQEWSFGGEVGATLFSGFQYTPIEQEGGSFDRGYNIPHNEGWILSYYPLDRKIFFLLGYTRFQPNTSDILVRNAERITLRQISTGTFNHTFSLIIGHQVHVGSNMHLKKNSLFFEPVYGVGIEWLRRYSLISKSGLINTVSARYETGINPSFQVGFRLSYRHQRSKFSIKALGNLGLRYHAEREYLIILPEESVLATIRSKSDFIAAQISYEYIFKSNKVEKRKEQKTNDLVSPFGREKIRSFKLGVHPTLSAWNRYFTFNYEMFPANQKKSWFLDITYWNLRRGLVLDGTHDWYREPFLDVRLGRHLFSDAEKAADWGVGYYFRSEFNLFRNRRYLEDHEKRYGEPHLNQFSLYAALGASLQYKWLIKDRWSVTPMFFMDIGLGNRSANVTKHRLSGNSLYFDAQARLYVGYRF